MGWIYGAGVRQCEQLVPHRRPQLGRRPLLEVGATTHPNEEGIPGEDHRLVIENVRDTALETHKRTKILVEEIYISVAGRREHSDVARAESNAIALVELHVRRGPSYFSHSGLALREVLRLERPRPGDVVGVDVGVDGEPERQAQIPHDPRVSEED